MTKLYKRLAILLAVMFAALYGCTAMYRAGAYDCKRQAEGAYIGEICYMTLRDSTLFRLYDISTGQKIAERFFFNAFENRIVWGDDIVYYSNGDDGEYVRLPPTWLDRLRAKLP